MKKLYACILALTLIAPFSFASAFVEDDRSFYIFYLQFKQGVLSQDPDAKFAYDVIPGVYEATKSSGDFYGEIVSGRKVALSRFWFDKPTTFIPAEGRSILEVRAPYFANADHVTFFSTSGKKLFTISLSESSFCNDNGICNKDVGESSLNCPNDCPPIPGEELPLPPEEIVPEVVSAPPVETITPAPITTEVATETAAGVAETETGTANSRSTVISLTIGVFLILLSILGWVVWKKMAPSDLDSGSL
ncbi:MAG: hypothetical protein A2845_00060 [Candidatus Lloydbacteria bacterium RIFCSPHIGHO2_01_FULL_49_22]|uniref:Uncharacterized protein n=1 Tax=Candidatus Lloydbacteria bacterium RIFCSPHIGHO2_01_FULL_49_22 TaxID=1798658 RepID=A0A1G2CYP8_9BACT|nr:MAG: hypothetical protein A2845_00060 [Candidatus Lloydbacteria bacterium RIFCSPHIGHO2_01_FULL_49_22]OGZ09837.1 MAG: hypothetical protein A3C14_00405 [Candidatus Lloydbacteria bacterium RIFCSPHIGHO2_02_FULL_50_18]